MSYSNINFPGNFSNVIQSVRTHQVLLGHKKCIYIYIWIKIHNIERVESKLLVTVFILYILCNSSKLNCDFNCPSMSIARIPGYLEWRSFGALRQWTTWPDASNHESRVIADHSYHGKLVASMEWHKTSCQLNKEFHRFRKTLAGFKLSAHITFIMCLYMWICKNKFWRTN